MTRKRKLRLNDSNESVSVAEEVEVEAPVEAEPANSNGYTIAVERHTHAGVDYVSGDPIVIDNPLVADKLKAKGIIS